MRKGNTSGTEREPFDWRADSRFGAAFLRGMLSYASGRTEQARTLCALAAACVCGIIAGVLCWLAFGERASASVFGEIYARERAFSAYGNAAEYLRFFSGWFCHHAVWLLLALVCALTVYPTAGVSALCFARGVSAGFGVCALGGGFSAFRIVYAAAEGALLCLISMLGAKSVTYAHRRAKQPSEEGRPLFLRPAWVAEQLLPLICGALAAAGALLLGLLLLSGTAELLLR